MKLLFIAPYRCGIGDGWSQASQDIATALIKTGHEITLRPAYLSNRVGPAPPHLEHFEKYKYDTYDVVIQHVLPHYFEYDGRIPRNIGSFVSETRGLSNTAWPERCKLMDEIWVPSEIERNNLLYDRVNKPIHKICHPIDVTKFERNYDKMLQAQHGKVFNFYFIGEFVTRKNLHALLLAFHLEFGIQEPVNLVLKLSRGGINPGQLQQMVENEINNLKRMARIYPNIESYKKEVILTNHLSEIDMYRLHTSCDCFVMPSHGEATCRPAVDAMGFGNTPIVTDKTGMVEFVNNSTGWVVDSYEAPVLCDDPPLPDIYTAKETWRNISIVQLRQAMREAFENKSLKAQKAEKGIEKVYEFSYENVAKEMNKVLG